jgi:hypothetical protein
VLGISSISDVEWISLKATLHAIENQELFCDNCLARGKDNPAAAEKFRAVRGCETPAVQTVYSLDNDRLKFKRCVGNYVSSGIVKWVSLSDQYAKGIMPFRGALTDQPAKVIELFSLIETWRSELQTKRMKEHQAKMARGGRRGR